MWVVVPPEFCILHIYGGGWDKRNNLSRKCIHFQDFFSFLLAVLYSTVLSGGLGDSPCDCLIAFYLLFVNVMSTIFLSNPRRHTSFYLYSERTGCRSTRPGQADDYAKYDRQVIPYIRPSQSCQQESQYLLHHSLSSSLLFTVSYWPYATKIFFSSCTTLMFTEKGVVSPHCIF